MELAATLTALAAVLASDVVCLRWLWRLSVRCRELEARTAYLEGRVNGSPRR